MSDYPHTFDVAPPTRQRVLLLGGERHGEWVYTDQAVLEATDNDGHGGWRVVRYLVDRERRVAVLEGWLPTHPVPRRSRLAWVHQLTERIADAPVWVYAVVVAFLWGVAVGAWVA